jgi:NAD(P)-dependent dehydrogenase (short-subunit alcohol dehydrogenase family)
VKVFSRCFDALKTAELELFYADVGKRWPSVDIVVNVVGGTHMGAFESFTPESWALDIHRNYTHVLYSTRAALPLLRKGGRGGSIINFTTIEAHRGAAHLTVYAGAKAATTNFSRALAVELGRERIRVNTMATDLTWTRGNVNSIPPERRAALAKVPVSTLEKGLAIAIPRGDAPTVNEIANGVLFLASDLSSGVTGSVLHVDGGTYAGSGFNLWPEGEVGPVPIESLPRLFPDDFEQAPS